MSNAEGKYYSELRRKQEAVDQAHVVVLEAERELRAFVANRDVHIAYNRAIEQARAPEKKPAWRFESSALKAASAQAMEDRAPLIRALSRRVDDA